MKPSTFIFYLKSRFAYLNLLFKNEKVSIQSFSHSPLLIIEGGIIKLSWKVENAWKITLSPQIGDVTQHDSIYLSAKIPIKEFTLTAYGVGEKVEQKIVLEITEFKPVQKEIKIASNKLVKLKSPITHFSNLSVETPEITKTKSAISLKDKHKILLKHQAKFLQKVKGIDLQIDRNTLNYWIKRFTPHFQSIPFLLKRQQTTVQIMTPQPDYDYLLKIKNIENIEELNRMTEEGK